MPARITSLTLAGYRRIRQLNSLRLGPLNVLIGANGSGKSTLLDALALLKEGIVGSLEDAFSRRGGFSRVLTRGTTPQVRWGLHVEDQSGVDNFDYVVQLLPSGMSYLVQRETLSSPATFGVIFDAKYAQGSKTDGATAQRPTELELRKRTENDVAYVRWLHLLGSITRVRLSYLDLSANGAFRRPQTLRPVRHVSENGEDICSMLYELRSERPERFESLIDSLRAAFPTFDRLELPLAGAGTVGLQWHERDGKTVFDMADLSDGIARFLWLVTILHWSRASVLMIDEPELSLHPELLAILVDLLREASLSRQIIVATQSERLVQHLKSEEVIVCNVDDSAASFRRGDEMDLAEWLVDYSLDELWRKGLLGGRA
jgi:predicted ATPase